MKKNFSVLSLGNYRIMGCRDGQEDSRQTMCAVFENRLLSQHLAKFPSTIYSPDTTMHAWRRMIKEDMVKIKYNVVALLVGNSELPLPLELSAAGQMKKLILAIWEKYSRLIKKVVVLTVLPRPDQETELENEIKVMNNGFYKAVKEVKCHFPGARSMGVLPVHCLFLERYEYFDFSKGHTVYLLRVIKPVSRHFVPGMANLNSVGVYHLHSHMLQELGFLMGVNSWDGIPVRYEPGEIQADKRKAWLRTQQAELEQEREAGDTDVEDEFDCPIMVVPESLLDHHVSDVTPDEDVRKVIPVYVQGKLVPSGDICLGDVVINE